MEKEISKILCLGDIHLPFCDWEVLEQAREFKEKHKPDLVMCMGDMTDQKAWSKFLKDPGDDNPDNEWKKTIEASKKLAKMFPSMHILDSNHDRRYVKKASEAGISRHMLRTLDEMFPFKGWRWRLEPNPVVINNIAFMHGDELQGSVKAKVQSLGMNVVQGHCLPTSYKVLTEERGFVPIGEIDIGERVYGYSDGRIVLTEVKDTQRYSYNGKMFRFDHPKFKQFMTEKHHLKLKDGSYVGITDCMSKTIAELPITPGPLESEVEIDIDDNVLRLIVAIAADGSWDGPFKNLRFHLKKERKIQRLDELFCKLKQNLEWSDSYGERKKTKGIDRKFREELYELIPDKKLPFWFRKLSTRQTKVVIDELEYWDGSKIVNQSFQYSSSRKDEANLVQEMLLKCGVLSRILTRPKASYKDNYIVTYNLNQDYQFHYNRRLDESVSIEYVESFPVACLTTDTSSFVVLTDDGTVEITGNSHKAEIIYNCTFDKQLWGADVGCMVDAKSSAFDYAARYITKIWVGFGWIQDNVPYLFPKKR